MTPAAGLHYLRWCRHERSWSGDVLVAITKAMSTLDCSLGRWGMLNFRGRIEGSELFRCRSTPMTPLASASRGEVGLCGRDGGASDGNHVASALAEVLRCLRDGESGWWNIRAAGRFPFGPRRLCQLATCLSGVRHDRTRATLAEESCHLR